MTLHPVVRPDEHPDPVSAVRSAHRRGSVLSLATAGTTSTARRIVRTTDSWWNSFDAYANLSGVRAGARLWVPGPMTSTMVLFAAVHAAEAGAQLVDDPIRATHACLTPTQLWAVGDCLKPGTVVTTAGASLPAATRAAAQHRGLVVRSYYGAAELSFVAADPDGDGLRTFPQVEIDLREAVIWVRSPWLCSGYDGPTGSLRRDNLGWATVGDLGAWTRGPDQAPALIVRGRPEAITTGGATVLIADIESVLAPLARAPFAVHAVPHPFLGAVVGLSVTDPEDETRLLAYARQRLPLTHRPRQVLLVSALPQTSAGKLDRDALTEFASTRETSP
ncbi:MAG: AMP-binding enzyme [Nostocoides sp.]